LAPRDGPPTAAEARRAWFRAGSAVGATLPPTRPFCFPNRIKSHRKVRAGDLVPHEWNFRLHVGDQRAALDSIYREVGFACSLLAFELPDGCLKLIDGHLRRDLAPDMQTDSFRAGRKESYQVAPGQQAKS
jgi:hypothetical protein